MTLSARRASGHQEPTYDSSVPLSLLPGSGVINGTIVVNGKCSNCVHEAAGALNIQSKAQPWLWGIGPGFWTFSDDPTATVYEHDQYGTFALDMTSASSKVGGVPTVVAAAGSQTITAAKSDPRSASVAHGAISAAAFVLIMPAGVLSLVVGESVRAHWVLQTIGFAGAILGAILGLYLSTTYNFTKTFNNAHQIVGLVVAVALIAQFFMGGYNHWVFKRTRKPTPFGKVHRFLGHPIMLAGMINGMLGLSLIQSDSLRVPYTVIMAIATVALIAGVIYAFWRNRQRNDTSPPKERNSYGSDWISKPSRAYVSPSGATKAYRTEVIQSA